MTEQSGDEITGRALFVDDDSGDYMDMYEHQADYAQVEVEVYEDAEAAIARLEGLDEAAITIFSGGFNSGWREVIAAAKEARIPAFVVSDDPGLEQEVEAAGATLILQDEEGYDLLGDTLADVLKEAPFDKQRAIAELSSVLTKGLDELGVPVQSQPLEDGRKVRGVTIKPPHGPALIELTSEDGSKSYIMKRNNPYNRADSNSIESWSWREDGDTIDYVPDIEADKLGEEAESVGRSLYDMEDPRSAQLTIRAVKYDVEYILESLERSLATAPDAEVYATTFVVDKSARPR